MNELHKLIYTCFIFSTDICEKDWFYFIGYCYRKVASCDSWSRSHGKCATQGANLPSIHSQEENVFVQSLHCGEKSWLGLSDINKEGKFVWTDGTSPTFITGLNTSQITLGTRIVCILLASLRVTTMNGMM